MGGCSHICAQTCPSTPRSASCHPLSPLFLDLSVQLILPVILQAFKVLPTPALDQESIYPHNRSPTSTSMRFDASSVPIHLFTLMPLDIYTTTPPFTHPAPRPEFNPFCTQASTFPSTHWVFSLDQLFPQLLHVSFSLITIRLFLPSSYLSSFLLTYLLVFLATYTHQYYLPSPPSQHAPPVA